MRYIFIIFSIASILSQEIPLIQKINDNIDGHWALSSDWTGYIGVGLYIAKDDYEISFYSDYRQSDKPYPWTERGKISVNEDRTSVSLLGKLIYGSKWHLIKYENRDYLIDGDNYSLMIANNKIDTTRFLSLISNKKEIMSEKLLMNVPIIIHDLPFPE